MPLRSLLHCRAFYCAHYSYCRYRSVRALFPFIFTVTGRQPLCPLSLQSSTDRQFFCTLSLQFPTRVATAITAITFLCIRATTPVSSTGPVLYAKTFPTTAMMATDPFSDHLYRVNDEKHTEKGKTVDLPDIFQVPIIKTLAPPSAFSASSASSPEVSSAEASPSPAEASPASTAPSTPPAAYTPLEWSAADLGKPPFHRPSTTLPPSNHPQTTFSPSSTPHN
jgi:hypothetical protein